MALKETFYSVNCGFLDQSFFFQEVHVWNTGRSLNWIVILTVFFPNESPSFLM